MSRFDQTSLKALEASATTAAAYLDACDAGARTVHLIPERYQAYGNLLIRIFSLVDARTSFPALLASSAAAREIAESIELQQRIETAGGTKPGGLKS